ncbi:MAG: hypothetical protein AAB075_09805 [Gemmatimonadota bacterium]
MKIGFVTSTGSVASIVLLLPGLLGPGITISARVDAFGKTREIFRQTQTTLQVVTSLHESGSDCQLLKVDPSPSSPN